MYKRKTRTFMVAAIAAIMSFVMTQPAFATGGNTGETAFYATIPASVEDVIDFTITESITLTSTDGSVNASVNKLGIENNADNDITASIKLMGKNGWTPQAYSSSWAAMAPGTKSFGLQADGTKDMSETASGTGYTVAEELAKDEQDLTEFTGKVPAQLEDVTSTQMASIIATIKEVSSNLTFTLIDTENGNTETELEYEEGMTWTEWANSDYNTIGLSCLSVSGGLYTWYVTTYGNNAANAITESIPEEPNSTPTVLDDSVMGGSIPAIHSGTYYIKNYTYSSIS